MVRSHKYVGPSYAIPADAFSHLAATIKGETCLHDVSTTMLAKVRRWGNGLALRVHKRDLDSAGVAEGDVVQVELVRSPERGRLDLTSLPTFEDKDKRASVRHDRHLYG